MSLAGSIVTAVGTCSEKDVIATQAITYLFLLMFLCLSPRQFLSSSIMDLRFLDPLLTAEELPRRPVLWKHAYLILLLMFKAHPCPGRREPLVTGKTRLVAGSSSPCLSCSSRFPMPCSPSSTVNAPIRTLLLI